MKGFGLIGVTSGQRHRFMFNLTVTFLGHTKQSAFHLEVTGLRWLEQAYSSPKPQTAGKAVL